MKTVALIPARKQSKRCPGKNVRLLGGIPLIVWTIRAAQESVMFDEIVVCSDDPIAIDLATREGVMVERRHEVADEQPDVEWVRAAMQPRRGFDIFSILRPTSPFRTSATIRRAYQRFRKTLDVHSLRAVEIASQHPGKMWTWQGMGYPIKPLLDWEQSGIPAHSSPTQTLPKVYIQNASLEIAWTYLLTQSTPSISGSKVLPFFTEGLEGFDINTEDDFTGAERIVSHHPELIPHEQSTAQ